MAQALHDDHGKYNERARINHTKITILSAKYEK